MSVKDANIGDKIGFKCCLREGIRGGTRKVISILRRDGDEWYEVTSFETRRGFLVRRNEVHTIFRQTGEIVRMVDDPR